MTTDYKITNFHEEFGQIEVLFTPLNVTIAIDLPIDADGNVPTGDPLDAYIKGFLPYGALERSRLIGDGIKNAAAIWNLIEGAQ